MTQPAPWWRDPSIRWTHAPEDPPRVCWGCIQDEVNAPDDPMPEHDPEPIEAEHDPDTGTDEVFCVCGHSIERQGRA